MDNEELIQFTARLPAPMHDQLAKKARSLGINRANALRIAVAGFVADSAAV